MNVYMQYNVEPVFLFVESTSASVDLALDPDQGNAFDLCMLKASIPRPRFCPFGSNPPRQNPRYGAVLFQGYY